MQTEPPFRTRWFQARPPLPFQLEEAGVRQLLLYAGSLSRLLQRISDQSLSVELQYQGPLVPGRDESRLMGLSPRHRSWCREVNLRGLGEPWVHARTLMPLNGPRASSRLRHLGTRPLGQLLFQEPGWQRSPFQLGLARDTRGRRLWARRSLFIRGRERLLVSEWFYPAFWEMQPGLHLPGNPNSPGRND